ncbi:Error-prone repair protein ImuA [Chryseolinea sp. T2]|uniref:ImuA family protein n=1 Tax=Chryseolinea sp. T2 TaxID=3129255 RepID=UPI003077D915
MALARAEKVAQLKQDIHRMEGFRPAPNPLMNTVLGPLEEAFPSGAFPLGVLHEFLVDREHRKSSMAASVGFIAAMVSSILSGNGVMLWVSAERKVFPPSLIGFGVKPDQVIFVDIKKARNVLWATEEALKCSAVAVVVAEVGGLDLTISRRLQLSAEQSQATGFLIRNDAHPGITSSATRWRISPTSSIQIDSLPGVGHPRWIVELLKLRGGMAGKWTIQYRHGRFEEVNVDELSIATSLPQTSRRVG